MTKAIENWEKRVKEAFAGDLPPIVEVEHFEKNADSSDLMRMMVKTVHYGVRVLLSTENIKDIVIPAFARMTELEGLVIPADHGGMSDVHLGANMKLILPNRNIFGVTAVTFGCDHEMDHRQKGRCYYESQCSKCNYSYCIDSGD